MNLYRAMKEINKLKQRTLALPIAKKEVVVSPLSIGDDLTLKTALVSPVRLDAELLRLLWQHTEVWVPAGEDTGKTRGRKKKDEVNATLGGSFQRINEAEFYSQISYYDKIVLMWGIYLTTYGTLGERELTCGNENCKSKFKIDMDLDDTLKDDSLTIFEEDAPFTECSYPIIIDINEDYTLEFTTRIPSMANYNQLMRLVSIEEIQSNLEKIRSQFSMEQLMTLYTKNLAVYSKKAPENKSESSAPQEILSTLRDCTNIDISTQFMKAYHEHFSKYNVQFYKDVECPVCHEKIRVEVDVEWEFFRKQLSSGE